MIKVTYGDKTFDVSAIEYELPEYDKKTEQIYQSNGWAGYPNKHEVELTLENFTCNIMTPLMRQFCKSMKINGERYI